MTPEQYYCICAFVYTKPYVPISVDYMTGTICEEGFTSSVALGSLCFYYLCIRVFISLRICVYVDSRICVFVYMTPEQYVLAVLPSALHTSIICANNQ